ncbi:helix-turn-helix domain-containing protein [Streptomyces rimosus]|nr:helix-turn-helix transcriptional regulator [Streptomyces rimosus]
MNPLPPGPSALRDFAAEMRLLRRRAGTPSLVLMRQRCGISEATLHKAHSGRHRPTWEAVRGYVEACGGDPEEWRASWIRLCAEQAGTDPRYCAETLARWTRTGRYTPPESVTDAAELRRLLQTLLKFHSRSLRTLALRAPGYSHDTFGAVLRGDRQLTASHLKAILLGCGVHSLTSLDAWFDVLGQVDATQTMPGARIMHDLRQKQEAQWAHDHDVRKVDQTVEDLEKEVNTFQTRQQAAATRGRARDIDALLTAVLTTFDTLKACIEPTVSDTTAPQLVQRHLDVLSTFETRGLLPGRRFLDAFVPLALPHQQALQSRAHEALHMALTFLYYANRGDLSPHEQLSLLPPPQPKRSPAPRGRRPRGGRPMSSTVPKSVG